MKNVNFAVCFQLKKNKSKNGGEVPIYLRITVDGDRFETSTHRTVNEKQWDNRLQRVKGKSEATQVINNYLEEMHTQVNRYYNLFMNSDRPITIDDFKSKFQGGRGSSFSLIQVFEESNKLIKLGLGHKYSESTYNQYLTTLDRLKKFLKKQYKTSDIELAKLDISFMSRFENFLRTEYGIGDNTVMKHLKQIKKVAHYAMKLRYIKFDPFFGYQTTYSEVDRGYLTRDELKRIEEKRLRIKRLEEVRDVFVFVCYTGLSYGDLKSFSKDYLTIGIDGKKWIKFERKKTGVKSSIPLLSPAQAILDKYKCDPECIAYEKLLPVKSNQKLNSYLAEIAELCEIDKHITMHLARHTFATTVTLTNGVSIESVKQMLGHKNLSTTQIYSRVTDTKVSEDMSRLQERLNNTEIDALTIPEKRII